MTPVLVGVIIGATACGLGGLFTLIGYLRGRMTRGWLPTTGVVVRRRTGDISGGMAELWPTFQWQDQHGQVHQRTSNVRASLGPSPGKHVPVRFDPDQPSRAIIDSMAQNGQLFFLIGITVMAVGVLGGVVLVVTWATSL